MFSEEFFQYAHKLLNKIQTVKYNTILVNDNLPPVPVHNIYDRVRVQKGVN